MLQAALTPLRILEFREVNYGTAHAKGRAFCDDGRYYVVKQNDLERNLCATEYFCHALAEMLNLPILQYKPLVFPNGELAFGSAQLDPILDEQLAYRLLVNGNNNEYKIENFKELLSAALAFDLVVANWDRNIGNYVLKLNPSASSSQQSVSANLIDFGSSQILTGAASETPLNVGKQSNTMRTAKLLRDSHGFSNDAAVQLLRTLDKGDEFLAEKAFFGMPDPWFTDVERQHFLERVRGGFLKRQIEFVRNGFENGDFV